MSVTTYDRVDNPQAGEGSKRARRLLLGTRVQVRIQDRLELGQRLVAPGEEVVMTKEIAKSSLQKRPAVTVSTAPSPRAPQAKPEASEGSAAVTPEQRQVMICEAAYYIAEQRGFEPGHDVDDWLAAERQIDGVLTSPAASRAGARLQG